MDLKRLKDYFEKFEKGEKFNYGLSEPFSWRGIYNEVAFQILKNTQMTKEEILKNINLSYTEEFYGYKGGVYTYDDYTLVHFETDTSSYTDGGYVANMITEIRGKVPVYDNEQRLIELAFTKKAV